MAPFPNSRTQNRSELYLYSKPAVRVSHQACNKYQADHTRVGINIMRTLLIIVGGLVMLGACLLAARWLNVDAVTAVAAKFFIPLWLLIAAGNMWVGVTRAGYSIAEELPIVLIIFAVPAALASLLWWKFG